MIFLYRGSTVVEIVGRGVEIARPLNFLGEIDPTISAQQVECRTRESPQTRATFASAGDARST
jgi:hypothetical protein